MKISTSGALHLMISEAVVLSTYKDSKGIYTIGVGHTASAGAPKPVPGLRLTLVEALDLFKRDLAKYEARVTEALGGAKVTQAQFDALVSFDYNSGGIFKAALTRHIRAGDFDKAAAAFMGWVKPKEIKGRREKEQRLFKTGDYGDLSKVQVWDTKPGKARVVSTANLLTDKPLAVDYRTVKALQAALNRLGAKPSLVVDGQHGDDTTTAIEDFQRRQGMHVDGIAGPLTWAEIDEQLALADEPKSQPSAPAPVEAPKEDKLVLIASVQMLLRDKGYPEVGEIDDKMGTQTRAAILAFQADNGMKLTGEVSDELLVALIKAPVRQRAAARENATAKDLKAKGDPVAINADWIKRIGIGILGASGLGGLFEGTASFEQITSGINSFKKVTDTVASLSPWVLLAIGGGLAIYFGSKVVKRQVEAYQQGRAL